MIPPLLLYLAAALLRLLTAIAQPRIAQCPRCRCACAARRVRSRWFATSAR